MYVDFARRYPLFVPLKSEDFQNWLKHYGPDYVRDAWASGIQYKIRYNQKVFAVDLGNGTVIVDPTLVEP